MAEVAPERARALDTAEPVAPLAPHHEQRRAGPVLPAEHDVRAELLVVEAPRVVGDGRVRDGLIAARVGRRARPGPRLPPDFQGDPPGSRSPLHFEIAPLVNLSR